jgi:hypothetical protein
VADKCPVYRAGGECTLSQLRPIESRSDVVLAVQNLLAMQFDRVQFASMVERLNGGFLTKDVNQAMSMFMDMLLALKELGSTQEQVTITAKAPGVISKFFGSIIEESRRSVAEAPPTPVSDVDVVDVGAKG